MFQSIASMSEHKAILIIDDAQHNIQLLGTMLENEGYDVLAATNGPKALQIATESPVPDLILLDIAMPEMDGLEVCRRLKANKISSHIPVIFISSLDDTEQKLRAFRAGAVDYIHRPFQSEEVMARVHTHLQLATIEELRSEIAERKLAEEALWNSQNKLNALTAELGLTEERERRRITQALHDQVMLKLAKGKKMLDQAVRDGEISAETSVTDLQKILERSIRDLKELSADLSPHVLYEIGLKSAIDSLGKELSEEHGFRFSVSGDEVLEIPEDLRITLFQMVRELLINVIKHAGASLVTVTVTAGDESISIELCDDGRGFGTVSSHEGFGLAYISQRVGFLGGTMNITSSPGKGSQITISLPKTTSHP